MLQFIKVKIGLTHHALLTDNNIRKRYDVLNKLYSMNLKYDWIYNALAWTPIEYPIARNWITMKK